MFIRLTILILLFLSITACSKQEASSPSVVKDTDKTVNLVVFKSPSCGCCSLWVEHLQDHSFLTQINDTDDLAAIKKKQGIAPEYQSCHTAVSQDGYVFEGHIPAHFIQKFLDSPPENAIGLAVPGMPLGSPGMVMGDAFSPYDIYVLKKDGSRSIFAHVATAEEQYP